MGNYITDHSNKPSICYLFAMNEKCNEFVITCTFQSYISQRFSIYIYTSYFYFHLNMRIYINGAIYCVGYLLVMKDHKFQHMGINLNIDKRNLGHVSLVP